jgi:hypothetical protein
LVERSPAKGGSESFPLSSAETGRIKEDAASVPVHYEDSELCDAEELTNLIVPKPLAILRRSARTRVKCGRGCQRPIDVGRWNLHDDDQELSALRPPVDAGKLAQPHILRACAENRLHDLHEDARFQQGFSLSFHYCTSMALTVAFLTGHICVSTFSLYDFLLAL